MDATIYNIHHRESIAEQGNVNLPFLFHQELKVFFISFYAQGIRVSTRCYKANEREHRMFEDILLYLLCSTLEPLVQNCAL